MQWLQNQWRKIKDVTGVELLLCKEQSLNAADLLSQAKDLLERGKLDRAFSILNRLKGSGARAENLDFFRAECFRRLGQPISAIESLKEELRYFPHNAIAATLLSELMAEQDPSMTRLPEDAEFAELYRAIRPYTMVGELRLFSLFNLARQVSASGIAGNFVECGVAAGGSSALLASVISRYSREPRRLYSFDTFEGMPEPSKQDVHAGLGAEKTGWGTGTCAAPEQSLLEVCEKLGVGKLVTPVKGLFATTLPEWKNKIGTIAFLHMDGDWYSSSMDILVNLYSQIQSRGVVQVDDYGYWDGCRTAIEEFQAREHLTFELNKIDETGVWFMKEEGLTRQ